MKRIVLRAMEPEDLELLYGIENDPELWEVGSTTVPYSRYVLHDYLAHASGDIYTDRQVRLVIENEAHEAIGLADLLNFDPKHCRAEVGIVIVAVHRGQGYATEALSALHDYARLTLHLHQLYAFVSTANQPSIALFEKLGYRFSQPLTDWLFDGHAYSDALIAQKILGSNTAV